MKQHNFVAHKILTTQWSYTYASFFFLWYQEINFLNTIQFYRLFDQKKKTNITKSWNPKVTRLLEQAFIQFLVIHTVVFFSIKSSIWAFICFGLYSRTFERSAKVSLFMVHIKSIPMPTSCGLNKIVHLVHCLLCKYNTYLNTSIGRNVIQLNVSFVCVELKSTVLLSSIKNTEKLMN